MTRRYCVDCDEIVGPEHQIAPGAEGLVLTAAEVLAVLDGLVKCDRRIAPGSILCDRPSTVTGTDFGHGMVRETCDKHRPTGNDVMDLPWVGVVRHAQLTVRVVASTTKPLRPSK